MGKASLDIEFEFGSIDGRYMTVQVNGQEVVPTNPHITVDISLPTTVRIDYSGKDSQNDTKLDESGNIIADLYAKIKTMRLDGFPMSQTYLYQKLTMHTQDGQVFNTCYAGFNGYMEVVLDQPTVFAQYILMNS
jgi:hypothetical protein